MKSFKNFITEKLKITSNSIEDPDLVHIADMLSDYIEELAYQNDANIEDTIDELKDYNVYDCLSYWNDSVEDFIQYFNNNSVKKYDEAELVDILTDHANELTEMVIINLNH